MDNTTRYEFKDGPNTLGRIAQVSRCSNLDHVKQAMQNAKEKELHPIYSWCSFFSDYDFNPEFKHCIYEKPKEGPKVKPCIAYVSGTYLVEVWSG